MFTVGQKVVSLHSFESGHIKEGDVKTIQEIRPCHGKIYLGFEFHVDGKFGRCGSCGKIFNSTRICFLQTHFVPLEDIEAMNEFFNEITQPETIQV